MILICFSDFGKKNTIGNRAYTISKELKPYNKKFTVFCRSSVINWHNVKYLKVLYFLDISLLGFSIYVLNPLTTKFGFKIKLNNISRRLFEEYIIFNFKKIPKAKVVHSWDFLPKIYKYIKGNNPHIKIVQDVPMAFPNVLKEIKDYDILFKGEKLELPRYVKDTLKYIDYYIAPSNFVKKSLINEGIDKEKIFVVPFGVDVKKFKPVEKDHNETFKVAFSGNVNNRKGIPYLIQAWKELNLKDAELNIYGRVYPEVKKYFKDAEKYNIKIHGFVSNIYGELPKNHIHVFPSLLEGSAKSIYEALACGLPVITTENSGSVVEDEKEGFIIPTQDIEILKEKILFFYNNRDKIEEFGKNARKKAEQYTWENYGKRVNEIYNLVSENGSESR
jgi:glycosyltransferase involved in cell wall biosynthesis